MEAVAAMGTKAAGILLDAVRSGCTDEEEQKCLFLSVPTSPHQSLSLSPTQHCAVGTGLPSTVIAMFVVCTSRDTLSLNEIESFS